MLSNSFAPLMYSMTLPRLPADCLLCTDVSSSKWNLKKHSVVEIRYKGVQYECTLSNHLKYVSKHAICIKYFFQNGCFGSINLQNYEIFYCSNSSLRVGLIFLQ